MRRCIGLGLLAVIGLLIWAWWLPTLLAIVVTIALGICLDWPHVQAVLLDEMFVSGDRRSTVMEWQRKAADWDTYAEMVQDYRQTVRRKEEALRQLRGRQWR
jgi:hypothetical protein